jgi:hypothetical protein
MLTLLPPGSYASLGVLLLMLGRWEMPRAKLRRMREGRTRARRQAEQWCGKNGLGRHEPRACLGFAFRMPLDGCSDGAARGEGGAMSKGSAGGNMVARAGGAAAAMADDRESSEAVVLGGRSGGKGQGTDHVSCWAALLVEREKLSTKLLVSAITETTLMLVMQPLRGHVGM